MENINIVEAEILDKESGIIVDVTESKVSSSPHKSSTIEERECNSATTLKSDSGNGDQNPLDTISLMSPLVNGSNVINLINGGGELCHLTPSLDSDSILISSSPDQTNDLEALSDPETPTERTFDPFAPAPEEFALAPKKKMLHEFKISTRRKLDFDTCCNSEEKVEESNISDDESYIMESLCKSFIELILSNQVEENRSKKSAEDNSSDDAFGECKTPTALPLLTGIAETCPDAPIRPRPESRKPNQSICRKLEFGSCLI